MPTLDLLLLSLVTISALTDIFRKKIYNVVTLTVALLALTYQLIHHGYEGLEFSFLGLISGLALYLPLYFLQIMGAGDVKLLAVIGSIKGWRFALSVGLNAFILGGIIGIIYLLYHKRFITFIINLKNLLLSLSIKSLHTDTEIQWIPLKDCLWIPYGVAIFFATISVLFRLCPVIKII